MSQPRVIMWIWVGDTCYATPYKWLDVTGTECTPAQIRRSEHFAVQKRYGKRRVA